MRSQGEIKQALLRLRFTTKLPMKKMADDSMCSIDQIKAAMRMEASESVCRRLDAYLDAKKLHRHDRDSKLLSKIEDMTFELTRFWKEKTLPMHLIYPMPVQKQSRLATAMEWRLKRLLREKVKAETGTEPRFADAASYWQCKRKVYVGGEFVTSQRKPDRGERSRPMGQSK